RWVSACSHPPMPRALVAHHLPRFWCCWRPLTYSESLQLQSCCRLSTLCQEVTNGKGNHTGYPELETGELRNSAASLRFHAKEVLLKKPRPCRSHVWSWLQAPESPTPSPPFRGSFSLVMGRPMT